MITVGLRLARALLSILCIVTTVGAEPDPGQLLFQESFEDTLWGSRGWYDGAHMEIVADSQAPDGERVNHWHWSRAGAVSPDGGGARLHLPPVTDVTMSFYLRLSDNWTWTGVPYHPHMFSFLTSADWEYVGPAYTHLTTYAELVNGIPRLALQDGRNVDTANVNVDLTHATEERAIAGCNGDTDGHGGGDCYRAGENWVNGKVWEAEQSLMPGVDGTRGPQWHEVRARFRLNRVESGVTHTDGVLQMWFDGDLIIDAQDVVLRTSRHPEMKFNQFFMGPHYGPGVPHPQSMWIDDLRIWASPAPTTVVHPTSWGQAKNPP